MPRCSSSALRLGVPVFVEKPLCTDPGDAARLAAGAGDRLFVMDKWRYHPGIELLAEIGRSGRARHRFVACGRSGSAGERGTKTWTASGRWRHTISSIALEILGRVPQPVAAAGHLDGGGSVVLHGLLAVGEIWHALEVSDRSPENERRIVLYGDEGSASLGGGWDEHVSVFGRSGAR